MTPTAETTDAVLAALRAVEDGLEERKGLDAQRAEQQLRWKREIRRWLAPMCIALALLVVGNVMVLLGLVVSRSNQSQLRANQTSILAGNERVKAVTDCIVRPEPTFQECVAARLAWPPGAGVPLDHDPRPTP